MREYSIVSPSFWIGRTGRVLRRNPSAQRLAIYLITCPTSEMSGVFYCPMSSIANDLGYFEPPSKGLGSPLSDIENPFVAVRKLITALVDIGFCIYDFDTEWVYVRNMAKFQIAERLSPEDNRAKGLRKQLKAMPSDLRNAFIFDYNEPFNLGFDTSALEAPSKALRSQDQEQDQDIDHSNTNSAEGLAPGDALEATLEAKWIEEDCDDFSNPEPVAATKKRKARTHPFDLKSLPPDWADYARQVRPDLSPEVTFVEFSHYWTHGRGQGTLRGDKSWFSSWQSWVRRAYETRNNSSRQSTVTEEDILRLAQESEAKKRS